MGSAAGGPVRRNHEPASLEAAYAELNHMLVQGADPESFVRRVADLAGSLVPGTQCVIALRRTPALDAVARGGLSLLPEGGIPSQRVPHGEPGDHDTAERATPSSDGDDVDPHGAEITIPLTVSGAEIGSLRVTSGSPGAVSDEEVERLERFSRHAAPALVLLLRHSAHQVLADQLQEAVATRAVIDQAMGVLMHARQITARQAFEVLRHTSQTTNRKVSAIAAEVVHSLTGHPPEPPRPLSPGASRLPPRPPDA